MTIEAHIIAFNESDIIALTVKHYRRYCERIVVHDNHSYDGTQDIARSLGCDVEVFGKEGILDDLHYLDVKNESWKGTRADFIIMADCDEILYHENILGICEDAKGNNYTIFHTQGYDMYSDQLPTDWLDVKEGIIDGSYSKTLLFSPKVRHIRYEPGAHICRPDRAIYSPHKLKVLHMRNAGGVQRVIDRHALYRPRLSKRNLDRQLGIHYGRPDGQGIFTDDYRRWEYKEKSSKKMQII